MRGLKAKYLGHAGAVIAVAVLAFAAGARPASATVLGTNTYNLTDDNCSGGCLTATSPSAGTVTVSDVSANTVQVAVQLASGFYFLHTGYAISFGFNITGNPTITSYSVTNSSDWSNVMGPSAYQMDGFGNFGYGLLCTVCGHGGSTLGVDPTSLTFDISASGLTAADLAALSMPKGSSTDLVSFGADVYSTATGYTGPVGSGPPPVISTPEPGALVLFGAGLLMCGVFAALRRRGVRQS